MTEQTLHPTPSWNAVAGEEFGALGVGLRREMQLFAAALVLFAALVLISWLREMGGAAYNHFDFGTELFAPAIILGFFAPLAVWKEDEPARRGYFWSMPVDRVGHEWLKMALGGAWMIGFLAVYLLWMLALMLLTGGRIEGTRTALVQSGGDSHWMTTPLPDWFLLVAILGFVIAYLIGSAVVVGSNRPWRWFVGVPIGFLILFALFGAAGMRGAQEMTTVVVTGRYGLGTALAGTTRKPISAMLKNGEQVMLHTSVPDLHAWLIAIVLWLAIALVLFALVARRHQEG